MYLSDELSLSLYYSLFFSLLETVLIFIRRLFSLIFYSFTALFLGA